MSTGTKSSGITTSENSWSKAELAGQLCVSRAWVTTVLKSIYSHN